MPAIKSDQGATQLFLRHVGQRAEITHGKLAEGVAGIHRGLHDRPVAPAIVF